MTQDIDDWLAPVKMREERVRRLSGGVEASGKETNQPGAKRRNNATGKQ